MSCRVLVVPEDPTYNGLILKPLVQRMLRECGRPNAIVHVLTNPRLRGFESAVAALPEVLKRYGFFDVKLFLPDADGRDLTATFAELETCAAQRGSRLLCCAAVQEVEAWLLSGHVSALRLPWEEVRADRSVKENIFEPFLAEHGDARRPGGGRDLLMHETLENYRGLLKRCPELADLESRLRAALGGTA